MGLFTNNESYNEYEVPVVEGYAGIDGRVSIMMEAYADDMNFFKELIGNDVAEVNAMREGADLEILAENAVTSAFGKLKEMIKKVWAKIKSLFEAFIARVTGFVAKDGKAYDKKYKALALKNVGEGRCSKIKYKMRKSKGSYMTLSGIPAAAEAVNFQDDLVKEVAAEKKDNVEVKEALISKNFGISNADVKTFKKDLIDKYYEDEEEFEGIKPEDVAKASNVLNGNADVIKALNTEKKNIEAAFKKMLKKCDDSQKEMDKFIGDKPSEKTRMVDDLGVASDRSARPSDKNATIIYADKTKSISACRTVLTCFQEIATAAIGAKSEGISMEFKQARKVMALAASAAGRKKVNESYEEEMALDFILDEEAAFAVDAFMA